MRELPTMPYALVGDSNVLLLDQAGFRFRKTTDQIGAPEVAATIRSFD
jgi:hypothetical protein